MKFGQAYLKRIALPIGRSGDALIHAVLPLIVNSGTIELKEANSGRTGRFFDGCYK